MRCYPLLALCFASLLIASEPTTRPTGADATSAELLRIQVVKPVPPDAEKWFANPNVELSSWKYRQGTEVTFMVTVPSAGITRISRGDVVVDHFGDDTGDFDDESSVRGINPGIDMYPGPDGHSAGFVVTCPDAPAQSSKRVHLSGHVDLQIGTDPLTVEQSVKLQPGEVLRAGQTVLRIVSADQFRNGQAGMGIQFSADSEGRRVAKIEWIAADGRVLHSDQREWQPDLRNRNQTTLRCFVLSEEVPVKARISYYTNLRHITIPFDLNTGLGMPAKLR